MGVLNEEGKVILPVIYDNIEFLKNGTQAKLELDGKVGRKLFLSHYPTLEPKYKELRNARSLRVTKRWSFALFTVIIDGQKGYIGENGVEYFDLE